MSARRHGAESKSQKAEVFRTSVIRGLENRSGRSAESTNFLLNFARHAR